MDFAELATKIAEQRGWAVPNDFTTILAFDPGHTTGYAIFHGCALHESGEVDTDDMEKATEKLGEVIACTHPYIVVIEDYRIYKSRAKHHIGSSILTARIIGCIETLCYVNIQPPTIVKQPASTAKTFCTNTKLKEWGFYKKGERHALDAIRHGCYYILFGAIEKKQRDKGGITVG